MPPQRPLKNYRSPERPKRPKGVVSPPLRTIDLNRLYDGDVSAGATVNALPAAAGMVFEPFLTGLTYLLLTYRLVQTKLFLAGPRVWRRRPFDGGGNGGRCFGRPRRYRLVRRSEPWTHRRSAEPYFEYRLLRGRLLRRQWVRPFCVPPKSVRCFSRGPISVAASYT